MSGLNQIEKAELAEHMSDMLNQILEGADDRQWKLARTLYNAMTAVALHGADSVGEQLQKRARDWLDGRNQLNHEVKDGTRRKVWEYIVDLKATNPEFLRGENQWTRAAAELNMSVGRVKKYYFDECRARIERGSPPDSKFPTPTPGTIVEIEAATKG